jgi:hypothetical protein
MNRLNRVVPFALALAIMGIAAAGTLNAQSTATRIFHRAVGVYFGTWEVFTQGNPTPVTSQTFVELTDT